MIKITPQASNRRHGCAGFTLLELTVVIVIISVLLAVAVAKLLKLRAEAERAAIMLTTGNLRSSLGMYVAKRIAEGDFEGVYALAGTNPMDLALRPPANYLGVVDEADPRAVEVQTWYFDAADRALVYRVEFDEDFVSPLPGPARARFRLQLVYEDRNRNGAFDRNVDEFQGIDLVPIEPFAWRKDSARG